MTVAFTELILLERQIGQSRFCSHLHDWYKKYPHLHDTYGLRFRKWIEQFDDRPYNTFEKGNSFGNGGAMRITTLSNIAACNINELKDWAKLFTEVSHNSKVGIKGAQAVAVACRLASRGASKEKVKKIIETEFGYNLNNTVDNLRKTYKYNETCQGTVPEAIICFLESTDFEDAIRNAISIGGDSDTLACITGGIAENFYKDIPKKILKQAVERLPKEMKVVLIDYYKETAFEELAKTTLSLLGK